MSLQFKFTVPLKKEQKEGVRFLIKNRGAGLCFSTGLGKTLTSLVAAGYLVNNDVIDYVFVFHTKSATKAFHDDVTQNTTLNYNLVIESLELKPAPVVNLIQYNIADKVKDQILKISEKYKVAAIMDEIQVLKTYRGKLRALYNSFRPYFDFVWGLTACVTLDSWIYSLRGLIKASEVKRGDCLVGGGKVTKVWKNNPEQIWEIELYSGLKLKGNSSHPVYVETGEWKYLQDIKKNEKVGVMLGKGFGACRELSVKLKTRRGQSFRSNEVTYTGKLNREWGVVLGWVVGDGFVRKDEKEVAFDFRENEKEIQDKVVRWVERLGYRYYLNLRYERGEIKICRLSIYSHQLAVFLKKLGVGIGKGKRVPESIFQSPVRVQKEFLSYLLAADGNRQLEYPGESCRKKSVRRIVRLKSACEELRVGVQHLLWNLGVYNRRTGQEVIVSPSFVRKFYQEIGFPGVKGSLSCEQEEILNIETPLRNERMRFIEGVAFDRVKSCKKMGIDQTVGYTTESKVYVANGIYSHNTPLANHIEDLFSLTDYLIPGYFGTEFQFKDMYCEQVKRKTRRNGKKWVFYEIVGYKNLEHLKKKIEAVWLKRSERMPTDFIFKSVGKLTDDEEAQYLKAAKGILDDSKELREFVTRLPSLQRAVDMSRTKQKALIQMLNELREQERGALIFFPFKEPLRAFLDLVDFPVKVMTGETSLLKRFEIQTYLKEHEFLFCTAAAARSLNLQIVDSVIFYTIPFELEIFMQMVGRVARPFVSKYEKVYITMLEVEDTIDVYRKELMKTNADLVNKLLDGDPNLPKDLAAKRRRVLIKLRKNLLWRIRK